jgi:NADPH:quinone reductase-like Zn-dependent oxidoreductase
MKLPTKIASGILIVLVLAIFSLAILLSQTDACVAAPQLSTNTTSMKAVVSRCYGSPDILSYEDIAKPTPAEHEMLVKVHAASVNPLDWHGMRGSPYFMRLSSGLGTPSDSRFGVDFAGVVEAVGAAVTLYQPGDEVFGGRSGAFAQYLIIPEDRALAHKPDNMSFEQAAAVPIAALSALQALRDKGKIKPGQKVLINGASGGVGTFAVQIAKSFGAEVTGVCSTRNVDMVRSIGADHVIDYKQEDYTQAGLRYDLIIDNVGNHSPLANRRALTAEGRLVIVGGGSGNWLGPLLRPLQAMLLSPFVEQELGLMLAYLKATDLATLGELMQAGKLTPVIDKRFTLQEVPAAIRYSETGRARGKIVVNLVE